MKNAAVQRKEQQYRDADAALAGELPPQEKLYIELLELFARKLNEENVRLVMIAINGQLDRFPHIRDVVYELDAAGAIDYIEVQEWFEGVSDFNSPEGHVVVLV